MHHKLKVFEYYQFIFICLQKNRYLRRSGGISPVGHRFESSRSRLLWLDQFLPAYSPCQKIADTCPERAHQEEPKQTSGCNTHTLCPHYDDIHCDKCSNLYLNSFLVNFSCVCDSIYFSCSLDVDIEHVMSLFYFYCLSCSFIDSHSMPSQSIILFQFCIEQVNG